MYLYPNEYNSNSVFFYTSKTNENLDYNNALLLSNLTFVEDYQGYIDQDINSYQINLVLSLNSNSQAKLFLIDEKKTINEGTCTIPANSAKFLYAPFGRYDRKYYMKTFNSYKKILDFQYQKKMKEQIQ